MKKYNISMIKRWFSITLLVWLFSQQLLAAVWATPNDGIGCADNVTSNCIVNVIQPMAHQMPMVDMINLPLTYDQSSSDTPHTSMICDLCITACQDSLIVINYQFFIKVTDFLAMISSMQTPINTFLDTAYRPPIFT